VQAFAVNAVTMQLGKPGGLGHSIFHQVATSFVFLRLPALQNWLRRRFFNPEHLVFNMLLIGCAGSREGSIWYTSGKTQPAEWDGHDPATRRSKLQSCPKQ
jgi:hypothetical protein